MDARLSRCDEAAQNRSIVQDHAHGLKYIKQDTCIVRSDRQRLICPGSRAALSLSFPVKYFIGQLLSYSMIGCRSVKVTCT